MFKGFKLKKKKKKYKKKNLISWFKVTGDFDIVKVVLPIEKQDFFMFLANTKAERSIKKKKSFIQGIGGSN